MPGKRKKSKRMIMANGQIKIGQLFYEILIL